MSLVRRAGRPAAAGALLLWLTPAAFAACDSDETFLFSCQAETAERTLALCGRQEDTGEGLRWLTLHFTYVTEAGPVVDYPADPAQGFGKFFFAHQFRNGLYEASLRFVDGTTRYRLFFRDAPPSDEPDTVAAPDAGLEIAAEGKPVEIVNCGEAPAWYFDQTRFVAACDMENPLGSRACEPDPPVVP